MYPKASLFLLGICILTTQAQVAKPGQANNNRLNLLFSWKTLDFNFPDRATRNKAIQNKQYIQNNNLPLGFERWHDKLFVTVPRWRAGVASTLNYINLTESINNPSPNLTPYPNYSLNNIHKKSGTKLVSAFRINVDVCDRLWLVDMGITDSLGDNVQISAPRIVIIDLRTDKIIKEHTFDKKDLREDSFFANIIVDTTPNTCDRAFAYIPDLGGYQLIVYDLQKDESYNVRHHYFYFDPLAGNYTIGGLNFQWTDGVFGVALSPLQQDGYRTLFFHPLSSTNEFAVSTQILRNKTIASDSFNEFKLLGSRGPRTQASAESLDERTGVLFYTLVNKDGVGCWNSFKDAGVYSPYTNAIVASDSETILYANDLKVDKEGELWVFSNKLPIYMRVGLDPEEVNYRIFRTPVRDAIRGTTCDPSNTRKPAYHGHGNHRSLETEIF